VRAGSQEKIPEARGENFFTSSEGLSGAGFILWIFVLAMSKPHRLKPALHNNQGVAFR
jgi:hypothetical protein